MSATYEPEAAAVFAMPALPYPQDALEPVISATTVGLHYGKHHQSYLDALNTLVAGTPLAEKTVEEIIGATVDKPDKAAIYNNATQFWAHNFYWSSLRPKAGGQPPAALRQKMEADFGSVKECKAELVAAAATQLGSGWTWLAVEDDQLCVMKTTNAETPLTRGARPLLVIDLWEHAYYLDFQNRRAEHVTAVLDSLINWGFAADNLSLHFSVPEFAAIA